MFYKGNSYMSNQWDYLSRNNKHTCVCVCFYPLSSVALCECDKKTTGTKGLWAKCKLTLKHTVQIYTHTQTCPYSMGTYTHTIEIFSVFSVGWCCRVYILHCGMNTVLYIYGGELWRGLTIYFNICTDLYDDKRSQRKYPPVLPILSLQWGCFIF